MKMLKTAAFAAVLFASLMLSSCTTYNSFKTTFLDPITDEGEQTIIIGVLEPQTGRNAEKGKAELKGIELANSIYSNVDGYKVVLSKVDTQSSVSATETAINGLVGMKPIAIIGAAGEATSLAASSAIEENNIPTITPSATNPLITQGNPYYFRASLTESQMGIGLAEYAAQELDSDRIGIVSLKNDSSVAAMLEGFENKVKDIKGRRSGAIVYQSETSATEEEIKTELSKLKNRAIDVCLMPMPTAEMDAFFTVAEEQGMTDITFLGTRAWGEADFIQMMEKHPNIKIVFPYETVLSGTDALSDSITEEAQRFQIEYANRYGADDVPTYNAALGYDSYLILINAIHNAKTHEGKDVRDALFELSELKCSTGSFSFDGTGNVIRSVTLSTLKDGKPVNEYVSESEAKSTRFENVEDQQEEAIEEEQAQGQEQEESQEQEEEEEEEQEED